MNKQIKQTLKDVYLIDQSLKVHEDILVKIIQKLLHSKPDSKIDEQFVQELRTEIIEKIRLLNNIKPQTSMFNTLFNKKFTYALGGMVVVACVIIITNLSQENGKLAINNLGKNAFGELSFSQQIQDSKSAGIGGGGFARENEEQIMVPPEMVNYNFIYTGDDFELNDGQVTVYRAAKRDSLSKTFSDIAKNINLDILDIHKFQNLRIGNIELSEDRDFGYSIYINLATQKSLAINMNWEKWPREEFNVPVEMLTDEELLSMANKFLSDYSINMDMYEKGEVVKSEESFLETEKLGVISNVSILYPLKINDQIVYQQGGAKYGLNVSVNLRHKKVVSVYGVIVNAFEGSQYAKETNEDKIITFAENGGMFQNYIFPDATKTLDLELGTPEINLVRIWMPSEDRTDMAEMFVPSLIFPVITEIEQTPFYRANIVVPLIGELLDQVNTPMPTFDIPISG